MQRKHDRTGRRGSVARVTWFMLEIAISRSIFRVTALATLADVIGISREDRRHLFVRANDPPRRIEKANRESRDANEPIRLARSMELITASRVHVCPSTVPRDPPLERAALSASTRGYVHRLRTAKTARFPRVFVNSRVHVRRPPARTGIMKSRVARNMEHLR